MNRSLTVVGVVALAAILLLMSLAYAHSLKVENMYDERMHRDIQTFAQQLAQTGMPEAQIKVYRSALLDMNRNTLSYVSSEIGNVTSVFSTMAVIVVGFGIALFGKVRRKKETDVASS